MSKFKVGDMVERIAEGTINDNYGMSIGEVDKVKGLSDNGYFTLENHVNPFLRNGSYYYGNFKKVKDKQMTKQDKLNELQETIEKANAKIAELNKKDEWDAHDVQSGTRVVELCGREWKLLVGRGSLRGYNLVTKDGLDDYFFLKFESLMPNHEMAAYLNEKGYTRA